MAEATKEKAKKSTEFFSAEPEKPKEGEKPPMETTGEGTTPEFTFNAADCITAECVVGEKAPADPCVAILQLSTDGVTFTDVSRKGFGYLQPEKTYTVAWNMAEFATGATPQIVSPLLEGTWEQARIKFIGALGVSITAHSALGVKEPEKPKKTAAPTPAAHGHR